MPVFELTSPNGKTYTVNAPEGATVEQAYQYLSQAEPGLFKSEKGTSTGIKPELGNLEGMPAPRPKAVQGLTVAQERGDLKYYDPAEAAKAFGRQIARAPGMAVDTAITLSNLSPSAMLGITPTYEPVGVKKTDEILGLKQTPAEYAGFGLMGDVLAPTFIAKPIGLAARGVAGARNAMQKFANAKLSDYIAAAGDQAPDIINYLKNAQELVPGSKPTVAQALAAAPQGGAEYTRFIGLQPQEAKIPKELISAYDLRGVQQAEARTKSLGEVAQTPQAKAVLEGQRTATTEPMFTGAREGTAPVDIGHIADRVDDLIAKSPGNPRLVKVLERFRKGITIPETSMTPELIRTNAQELSSSLDGLKAAIGDQKNKFIKRELTDLKDQLVAAIPGMEEAQTTFANLSKPINEIEIGTALKNTLTSKYAGAGERAGAFATKLSDIPKTVKTSTGMTAKTLEDAGVSKENVDRINKVMEDLNRSALAEERLSAAGSTMSKDPNAPHISLLDRTVTVFNKVVSGLVDKLGRKKALEIAAEMLDPQIAAKVLEQAMAMEKAQAARSAAAARVAPAIRNVGTPATVLNALAPPNQNSLAGQ